MGSDGINRKTIKRYKSIKEYVEKSYLNYSGNCEVLKTVKVDTSDIPGIKNLEFYSAIRMKDGKVYGVVTLCEDTGDEWITFKKLYEEELPYYFNCPQSVLKLLDRTSDKNALLWRENCVRTISKMPLLPC